jgi:hypothetical protein
MTRIPIDAVTPERLRNLQDVAELVDEAGTVLALITPLAQPPYDLSEIPPFDRKEYERALKEGPGITTDELHDRLEKL